jgi:ABC-type polysaccharide/polyol phosphate export permease
VRWSVLGGSSLTTQMTIVSMVTGVLLLITGLWYFRKTENYFADVI